MITIKKIRILNPAAGKGTAVRLANDGHTGFTDYITTCVGDAERYTYNCCMEDGETWFIVCGGDGTLNEVVNGIMKAGAGDSAKISVIPTGSGNDFLRNFTAEHINERVDLLRYNGRYAANIINVGFDANVVMKMLGYKKLPLVNGSLAYIMGVADALMHRLGEQLKITFTDRDGNVCEAENNFLLTLAANGSYYGGGFNAAPLASVNDGLIDLLFVDRVSRPRFVSLITAYRSGTHLNTETGLPTEEFSDIMHFHKCKTVKIENTDVFCVDGELTNALAIEISVVEKAINFVK